MTDNEGQKIRVKDSIKHPAFKPSSKVNDIGIVVLEEPADISDSLSVFPICVYTEDTLPNVSEVIVVGFGKTEHSMFFLLKSFYFCTALELSLLLSLCAQTIY